MPYYKVVQVQVRYNKVWDEVTLHSVCENALFQDEFRVQYKIGEKVFPVLKNSPLFVFDSLDKAKYFVETSFFENNIQIWECEVENPRELKYRMPFRDNLLLEDFWSRSHQEKNEDTISTPSGTIGVDSVTLIRLVG